MVAVRFKVLSEELADGRVTSGKRPGEPIMANKDDWISKCVTDAREAIPLVTEGTTTRLRQLLESQLSERQLRGAELTEIARVLIADILKASPKTGTSQ